MGELNNEISKRLKGSYPASLAFLEEGFRLHFIEILLSSKIKDKQLIKRIENKEINLHEVFKILVALDKTIVIKDINL